MLGNTSKEFFTPFYPKNHDGSTNRCTSLLIFKEVERVCLDGKHLIKAEFVRYKHDTYKFLEEIRYEQEMDGLTKIFYIDPSHRNILNENLKILASGCLIN